MRAVTVRRNKIQRVENRPPLRTNLPPAAAFGARTSIFGVRHTGIGNSEARGIRVFETPHAVDSLFFSRPRARTRVAAHTPVSPAELCTTGHTLCRPEQPHQQHGASTRSIMLLSRHMRSTTDEEKTRRTRPGARRQRGLATSDTSPLPLSFGSAWGLAFGFRI